MSRRNFAGPLLAALACVAMLPGAARAQSAFTGVVKDASGAVLPGVTVEASSDVLIEKSRSVVTDGQGTYKIVDLRPGTYLVTFSLPGFSTVKREAIELPSNFTSTINAELKVGAVEETITVAGLRGRRRSWMSRRTTRRRYSRGKSSTRCLLRTRFSRSASSSSASR